MNSKILHISKYYYPDIGGIENTARDCVISLKNNCEQKVICFNHERGESKDIIDGIEICRYDCIAKISSQSISISIIGALKKCMREWKPEYVLLHWPNPYMACWVLKYCKRAKVIVYWHSDIIKQKVIGKFMTGLENKLLASAYKVIATSNNYIEGSKFLREYKEKCEVIPSCINVERLKLTSDIEKMAKKIREENANKTICFTYGRHVKYKGFEYLIEASKLVDDTFVFYIAGDGPMKKHLEKQAKNNTRVHLLGRLNDDKLKAYLLAADIFCFPSITKNEAFGLALAEGMYFGKPVVNFTIKGSGVNYVSLNKKTGIEIENLNIEEYAKALMMLEKDEKLRKYLGENAKKRVNDLFVFDIYSEKVKKLLMG